MTFFVPNIPLSTASVSVFANLDTWSVKSLPNKRALGTTTVPDPNSWALSTLTPASVIILDTAATSSSSQSSTVTLEETV